MGISVIGSEKRIIIGVQPVSGGVKIEGGEKPAVSYKPVGVEHPTDTADNGVKQDADGEASSFTPADTLSGSSGNDAPFGYTKSGRRRNRPTGGTRGGAERNTSKTTDSLASLMCMLHSVVSNMVKIPALKITMEQSQELTKAVVDVTELYDVPLPTEKVAAWMNLGAVAYKVYFVSEKPKGKIKLVPADDGPMPSFMSGN